MDSPLTFHTHRQKKHQKSPRVLSLNKTTATKSARMTGGMLHREEIAHLAPDLVCLMQQVDIASVPVAQVEITFTTVV